MEDAPAGDGDRVASDRVARDRATVQWQIGRPPRALAGIAVRCPFGHPAVTEQHPVDDEGRPFPTGHYLTCPHLVSRIDRIEADGGVGRMEQLMATDAGLAAQVDAAHDAHRARFGHDIAGSGDRSRLKCLHAHAAVELAMGGNPVGARVLDEAAPHWCSDHRCGAAPGPGTDTASS